MPYGIDFGTTNSAVVWDETVTLDTGQGRPFPSVVAIDKATGEVITGPRAREQQERLEQSDYIVIRSVKRSLGRPMTWRAGGRVWTPKMVACELFKGLKDHARQNAERTRNTPLDRAVISIPVGFTAQRRQELQEAAREAGIETLDLISEPTAAFLHCREELPGATCVAVFDWGGGTLDVSVLEIDGTRVRELATKPLERAGDDIDRQIAADLHRKIMKERRANIPFEAVMGSDLDKILVRAESAKIELSSGRKTAVPIDIPSYLGAPASVSLDPATLSAILKPIFDEAITTLSRALKKAQANSRTRRHDIDAILLVGGSSRLLGLQQLLEETYSEPVQLARQPLWAVSQGASRLARRPGSYELMQRLHLMLSDGYPHDLVPPRAIFNGEPHVHYVGVVEECKAAQLIFAESEVPDSMSNEAALPTQIGNLAVPVMGFDSEPIRLEACLTHNLTLRVTAQSVDGNADDARHWEYDRLRFAYTFA